MKEEERYGKESLYLLWLSLTILIFSSISIYADEVIQGDFFLKNIVINGENIVNYQLEWILFSSTRTVRTSLWIPKWEVSSVLTQSGITKAAHLKF